MLNDVPPSNQVYIVELKKLVVCGSNDRTYQNSRDDKHFCVTESGMSLNSKRFRQAPPDISLLTSAHSTVNQQHREYIHYYLDCDTKIRLEFREYSKKPDDSIDIVDASTF